MQGRQFGGEFESGSYARERGEVVFPYDRTLEDPNVSQARSIFLKECLLSGEEIAELPVVPELGSCRVIHLKTTGNENVVGQTVGRSGEVKNIYKHVFLAHNPAFRRSVVDYYRSLGVTYVDLVVLNRTQWKIFLFYS